MTIDEAWEALRPENSGMMDCTLQRDHICMHPPRHTLADCPMAEQFRWTAEDLAPLPPGTSYGTLIFERHRRIGQ